MPDDGFNLATATYKGTALEVTSITVNRNAALIDVGHTGDTTIDWAIGRSDVEISVETTGGVGDLDVADTAGTLQIVWNDVGAQTDTLTSAVISNVTTSGSLDDKVTGSITFKPQL